MFIIDDIVLFPVNSLRFILGELYNAVRQEQLSEAGGIRAALSQLYLMLESHQIGEQEFDLREKELLDRLDEIEAVGKDVDEPSQGERLPPTA